MDDRETNFNQFVRNLNSNSVALEYLKSRSLSENLISENIVGFCPPYSRYSFPLLKGRLIVPIKDVHGNIIALAGRKIDSLQQTTIESFWDAYGSEPAKCQDRINKWTKGKWINEPYHKGKNLYFLDVSKEYIRQKNYAIIVEGYFDLLSLYDNGLKNVCAISGTSISDYQISLLSRFCDHICILMDGDIAGNTAAQKISKRINELGLKAFSLFLPDNMDPDDFAKNYELEFLDNSIQNMIENDITTLEIVL
jgi:DNA primase